MEQRILVVDDEASIREVLERALARKGYVVRTAASGEEALEVLRRDSLMVMFLDIHLGGMNGLELCSRIRIDNPIAVLYALTGYTDLFGLLECRKAGFDDFFTKPVSLKVLGEAAEAAFEKLERWDVAGYELL